jgi:hypothetical protein
MSLNTDNQPVGGQVPATPLQTNKGLPGIGLTVATSIVFGPFGAIPAAIHADKAHSAGQSGARYWKAFVISWFASVAVSILAMVVLFAGLAFTIHATTPVDSGSSVATNRQPTAVQPTEPVATDNPGPNLVPHWPGAATDNPGIVAVAKSDSAMDIVTAYVHNVDSLYCSLDPSWAAYVGFVSSRQNSPVPTIQKFNLPAQPDCSTTTVLSAKLVGKTANGGVRIDYTASLSSDPTKIGSISPTFYKVDGYWVPIL